MFNIVSLVMEKLFSVKKLISNSKQRAEHLFVSQKTQLKQALGWTIFYLIS